MAGEIVQVAVPDEETGTSAQSIAPLLVVKLTVPVEIELPFCASVIVAVIVSDWLVAVGFVEALSAVAVGTSSTLLVPEAANVAACTGSNQFTSVFGV